jgi:hypothetical protein
MPVDFLSSAIAISAIISFARALARGARLGRHLAFKLLKLACHQIKPS